MSPSFATISVIPLLMAALWFFHTASDYLYDVKVNYPALLPSYNVITGVLFACIVILFGGSIAGSFKVGTSDEME